MGTSGIIIVRWGAMFVDFACYPYPRIYISANVLHCNATNQLLKKWRPNEPAKYNDLWTSMALTNNTDTMECENIFYWNKKIQQWQITEKFRKKSDKYAECSSVIDFILQTNIIKFLLLKWETTCIFTKIENGLLSILSLQLISTVKFAGPDGSACSDTSFVGVTSKDTGTNISGIHWH